MKKNFKTKLALSLLVSTFIVGCGSEGSTPEAPTSTSNEIENV
jgi:predicted small lipoprotein YifL